MERLAEILALLADIAELDDTQITDLRAELRQIYTDLRAEPVTAETVATGQQIAEAIGAINATEQERTEALAALEAQLAEIDASVLEPEAQEEPPAEEPPVEEPPVEEPPVEEPPAEEPPVAETAPAEPVAVAAAATPAPRPTPTPLAAARQRVPAGNRPPAQPRRPRTFATGNVPNMNAGTDYESVEQLAQSLVDTWEANANATGGDGVKVYVARTQYEYPDNRRLRAEASAWQNGEIMGLAVREMEALVAAGGICAPTQPYYEQAMISHSSRPVRDALVGFNADRGGINWIAPPTLASITTDSASGAINQVTAAQDAANTTKGHQFVTCGTPNSDQIYAVTNILEFGNLMQRTFPELVRAWVGLAEAAWARYAENKLLTAIGAHSTAVTTQQRLGAARDLLNYANLAGVAFRNRHRMPTDAPLVAMFPQWVVAMIQNDLASAWGTDDDDLGVTEAMIVAWFQVRRIRVVFFEDGVNINNNPNSGAQIFPAQATGLLNGWPTIVQWYLFHEGAHLFLDGGTLDLGIVRDSTLNAANKYQMFMESFENTVFVGIESLRIRSTICANGATSGTVAPTTLCTSGS